MTVAELGHLVAELDKRLSPSAKTVLEKRYLKRTPEGVPLETPSDMFAQVAENIAASDLRPLSKATMKKIDAIYGAKIKPLVHPYW